MTIDSNLSSVIESLTKMHQNFVVPPMITLNTTLEERWNGMLGNGCFYIMDPENGGEVTKDRCEDLLREYPDGTYAVRMSSSLGKLTISIKDVTGIDHIHVVIKGSFYLFNGKYYTDLDTIVKEYENGKEKLKNSVSIPAMSIPYLPPPKKINNNVYEKCEDECPCNNNTAIDNLRKTHLYENGIKIDVTEISYNLDCSDTVNLEKFKKSITNIISVLRSDNIVKIYPYYHIVDNGNDKFTVYFYQEYIEQRLSDLKLNKLDAPKKIEIWKGITRGIQHQHRYSIYNINIHPKNILFRPGSMTPLIANFTPVPAVGSSYIIPKKLIWKIV